MGHDLAALNGADLEALPTRQTPPKLKMWPLNRDQAIEGWSAIRLFMVEPVARSWGRLTLEDMEGWIREGSMMPILVFDPEEQEIWAVLMIESAEHPQKRVMVVSYCGGAGLEHWRHLYPALKRIAEDLRFDQIEMSGRPGWGRMLPDSVQEVARVWIDDTLEKPPVTPIVGD